MPPSDQAPPIYMRVADAVLAEIAAGRLIDGEKLPPERGYAQHLGVSIGTLRKALRILEDKHVLRRVQGSGNYVQSSGLRSSLYSMFRLELKSGGGLPTASVINVRQLPKDPETRPIEMSDIGTQIRRFRYLDTQLIALEEIWLDARVGHLGADDLQAALYATYRDKLNLWVLRAEDRVCPGRVPAWAPNDFPLEPGDVCGFVERLSWSDETAPVEHSRTWYDPSKAVYVQRIK